MSNSLFRPRNLFRLLAGHVPGQLIIQMTDQCNAQCPQCAMRVTERFERSTLSADAMRRMIDAAAARGVQALSFTGGEPLLMLDDMVALLRHAGAAGIPYLRTGTNGYLFKNPEAPGWERRVRALVSKLAATPLRNFWISIDSHVPTVHERMRGFPNLIAGIERALPLFHEAGIFPTANLGINRNLGGSATWNLRPEDFADEKDYLDAFYSAFRTAMRRFYEFVDALGFTIVNCCYPMSIPQQQGHSGLSAVYAATSQDRIIHFTRAERALLFKALFETVPEYRARLRIFSPRTTLRQLYRQYAGLSEDRGYACRGGKDFFFINSADGNAYPCGYRGSESLGRYEDTANPLSSVRNDCTDCDWECFRDPSELAGPLLQAIEHPAGLLRRIAKDPEYFRLWLDDLRYYRACDYFDGRARPRKPNLDTFSGGHPARIGTAAIPA